MSNPYQPPGADLGVPMSGDRLSDGSYEFNEYENTIIARAAKFSKAWGIIAVILGVVLLIMMIFGVAGSLLLAGDLDDAAATFMLPVVAIGALGPIAFVNLITGWYYLASGRAFQDVVDTRGNDVAHLMTALSKVAGAFKIEVIILIIAFALGILLQAGQILIPIFTEQAGGG